MADETAPQSTPFFSGWRPAIGWLSLYALGFKFAVLPLIGTVLVLIHKPSEQIPPGFNFGDLMMLLGVALGFGGMRSMEKIKGVKS